MKHIISTLFLLVSISAFCMESSLDSAVTVFRSGENGIHTYRIPAIVKAKDGSLLAFAEARVNNRADSGDIDLVMKRSSDGGKTWGEILTIWDDEGNVCGNPSPVVDKKTGNIILLCCWNRGDASYELTHDTYEGRRVFVIISEDNGYSWSKPREITNSVKLPTWKWYATGPCHATQLQSGRIVVPCNHGIVMDKSEQGTRSHVIYSDDGGDTWQIGGIAEKGNESTICELSNGGLLLNMRGGRPKNRESIGYSRIHALSKDGGLSFEKAYHENSLIEPVCNGAICNYNKNGKPTKWLAFTNPSDTTKRKNLTLKMSANDGSTWKTVCVIHEGPSAYSDLVTLPNGSIAVLYENGESNAYERISCKLVKATMIESEDILKPDKTVLLYPNGQEENIGTDICDAHIRGPVVSNGLSGNEIYNERGNISNVGDSARIKLFFPKKPNGQMVIVCPGGGYLTVCERKEGSNTAKWLTDNGISVCVVVYRVPNGKKLVPLVDVMNAMRYCRAHAEEWGIEQIGIMGFSAGGHLAAYASNCFDDSITRPDFSILIYPVIDLYHHEGTGHELVGDKMRDRKALSLQNLVSDKTPRTYLALSQDDNVVNPLSSFLYFDALLRNGIKAEMYVMPSGKHGWGFLNMEINRKDPLGSYRKAFEASLLTFLKSNKK